MKANVENAQNKIVKAFINKNYRKLHKLQYILVHSHDSIAETVRQTTLGEGKNTPSVDDIV